MKQLGNLAIVCAQRQDVELLLRNGKVCVRVHCWPILHTEWDDDTAIGDAIRELNFGRYARKGAVGDEHC